MPLPHLLWAVFSWIIKVYALLLVFVRVTGASLERRWYFVNRSWDALVVLSRELIKLASRQSSASNYGVPESLNSWVLSLALGFTSLHGMKMSVLQAPVGGICLGCCSSSAVVYGRDNCITLAMLMKTQMITSSCLSPKRQQTNFKMHSKNCLSLYLPLISFDTLLCSLCKVTEHSVLVLLFAY